MSKILEWLPILTFDSIISAQNSEGFCAQAKVIAIDIDPYFHTVSTVRHFLFNVRCLLSPKTSCSRFFFPASCSFDGSLTNCLSLAAAFYFQFLLYIPSNSSILCLPFNFYTPQNFALLCRNVLLSS